MARQRGNATYQTGALLLLLLCATCLFAGRSAAAHHGDSGIRAYGVVHVVKDTTVKSFPGPQHRAADDIGTVVADLPSTLAVVAFLLAGAVLTATAASRRRFRLAVVSSRAPPGGSALA